MRRRRLLALAACCAAGWALLRFSPFPAERLDGDWSWAAADADGGLLRLGLNSQGRYRLPMRLEDAPPGLVAALLQVEDRWFYWHPGINPLAVLRAGWQNWRAGGVRSGASTLSMQLARLMEPRPRTWAAKFRQALRALQIEARYPKRRILELYLSRVPMGGNLEGFAAASWLYFGRSPIQLSAGEAALLIALPRSPLRRRPDRDATAAEEGRRRVLQRLAGRWPRAWAGQDPARAPLPRERLANPYRAPHLLDRLGPRLRARPGLSRLTLLPGLQGQAEDALAAAVDALRPQGVRHGAVIVVSNRDRAVLAYVGSPRPASVDAGRVNGAALLRSPGSTLKPFLYGLALDQGLITPHSVLFDIPRDYGGYRPVNFGGTYAGPVTAEEALIRSLNTPAVWLESQLVGRDDGLLALLRRLGLAREGGERPGGLSTVLGALPLSLEELAGLYAGLADGGHLKPLRFFADEAPRPASAALMSPEAAYLVAQMLSKAQRPDLPNSWEFTATRGRVAFKTGTSFGFKDAWCLAVSPSYTVGVWLGNADGKGSPALLGAKAAAPLALALMNRLLRDRDEWFARPPALRRRRICAETGLPPGPDCPHLEEDDFIPGRSGNLTCRVHRRVWVRRSDGRRLDPACLGPDARRYRRQLVEAWPPDVSRYLKAYGARTLPYPPPAGDCPKLAALEGPRLLSPVNGARFELKPGLPLEQQALALRAQASPDADRLYWFVDRVLVADGGPAEAAQWLARPGRHQVSVVDSEGRAAAADIEIRGLPPAGGAPGGAAAQEGVPVE